jgi:hypothetical protein
MYKCPACNEKLNLRKLQSIAGSNIDRFGFLKDEPTLVCNHCSAKLKLVGQKKLIVIAFFILAISILSCVYLGVFRIPTFLIAFGSILYLSKVIVKVVVKKDSD